jgi:hypothetical protein
VKLWRKESGCVATSLISRSRFFRCLNIPARYCNGYLGDIGVPPDPAPMDFNAWLEAFLGDRWFTFDPRHNRPRIGRILISRGRDAAEVAMITTFGSHTLTRVAVATEEIKERASITAKELESAASARIGTFSARSSFQRLSDSRRLTDA